MSAGQRCAGRLCDLTCAPVPTHAAAHTAKRRQPSALSSARKNRQRLSACMHRGARNPGIPGRPRNGDAASSPLFSLLVNGLFDRTAYRGDALLFCCCKRMGRSGHCLERCVSRCRERHRLNGSNFSTESAHSGMPARHPGFPGNPRAVRLPHLPARMGGPPVGSIPVIHLRANCGKGLLRISPERGSALFTPPAAGNRRFPVVLGMDQKRRRCGSLIAV